MKYPLLKTGGKRVEGNRCDLGGRHLPGTGGSRYSKVLAVRFDDYTVSHKMGEEIRKT